MQHSIIYLAYGSGSAHTQTVFSVYSLLHQLVEGDPGEIRIVIYTDRPDKMPRHALISTIELKRRDVAQLRGPRRHSPRSKLGLLARAAAELPGPCIFVDSNTQWLRHPGPAFERLTATANRVRPTMIMHRFEVEIQPFIWPDYHAELTSGYALQEQFGIAKPWVMWKTAAIGLAAPGNFFEQALALTDAILATTRHRRRAAQLAVSLLGSSQFDIEPFDRYLRQFREHGPELIFVIDNALAEAEQRSRMQDKAFVCSVYPVEHELARLRLNPLQLFIHRMRKLLALSDRLRQSCRGVYSRI